MSKRLVIMTLALILALLCFAPVHIQAQKSQTLKYGDSVDQDLAASFTSQTYTFTGSKGDIVVILLQITPTDSSKEPNLKVSLIGDDPANPIDYTSVSSYTSLPDQLLADGTYTITVERSKDSPDKYTGKYNISLIQPTPLDVGKSVSGKLTADTKSITNAYYTIKSDKNFNLQLTPDANDAISFYATLRKFEANNALYTQYGSLASTSWFVSSTVEVPGSDGIYLVELETSPLYSGSAKNYSYSLNITSAE